MSTMSNIVVPANLVIFGDICNVLEQLRKKKKYRQEQNKILANFLNDCRLKITNSTGEKNSTFYPILRLLLPHCERERNPYNLKEKKLGALLVKVVSLNAKSPDAQKLINFSSVHTASQESDFAGVAYFVLKSRFVQKTSILTVGDVNEILDNIARADVENKGILLDEMFSYTMKKLTSQEFKWFLRMILKDLKLEMSENRILGIFHPHAAEIYENCSSIFKVCEELKNSNILSVAQSTEDFGVKLFFAVKPMLSERLDVIDINQIFTTSIKYHVEDKFDGERFQMHMKDGKFEYFSRNGYTYAKNYGSTYDAGLLTPDLKGCFSKNAHSFILDGEMMGWHRKNQCFGSKGFAYDIKKITENSSYRPCYCVFDILYYNGKSLIGSPDKGGLTLLDRLKILDELFQDIPGVIQHSKRNIVDGSNDVLNALNSAIENQDEGIVLKDVNSFYLANKRNAGWYKIKPEYTDDTMTDLDLVVIGAEEAENKRQGRAKSFYVACIDIKPGEPDRWVCVGRVASGLSYEERERVCAALERHWHVTRREPSPPCLYFNKEKPDFWLLPDHSIVFQIRATELVRSSSGGAEYTLRFPRVMRLRPDKPVADIMTLQAFNLLVSTRSPVIKMSNKRVHESQLNRVEPTLRKRTAKMPQVSERFRTKTSNDIEVVSKALLDRKLCIISDDDDCNKTELVKIIQSHGGKHVANPGPDTWCCVVGKLIPIAKRRIEMQQLDIITTAWLRSLPSSDTLCSLSPLDMLSIKPDTRKELSLKYDTFGDNYTEEIDEDVLKKCMKRMEPAIYLTTKEQLKVDAKLFGDTNTFSFLRSCALHVVGNNLNTLLARMYGASVKNNFSNITHLVIPKNTKPEDLAALKKNVEAKIVSHEWLETCFQNKRMVSDEEFILT